MSAKPAPNLPKRYFLMKKRLFHVGSYYSMKVSGAEVRLTGHGESVLVCRRRGRAEFVCRPDDVGQEVEHNQVIDLG